MIKKINKIRKLGLVFSDFKWGDESDQLLRYPFNRYNLIYGWTGSGKTTLSKLFNIIKKKIL
jgi:wobble nucleotide-excising tRNase